MLLPKTGFLEDHLYDFCPIRAQASLVARQYRIHLQETACNAGDAGSIPDQADSLEKEMATHSSILAWEIPWTEDPAGYSPESQELDTTQQLNQHHHTLCIFLIMCS